MSNPFDGITDIQRHRLFKLLQIHSYTFAKNQEVLPTIKTENIIAIIISGYAQIISIDYEGNENIIDELYKNSIFGTNISSTNSENYEIIAKENTEVVVIDYNRLINSKNLKYEYFNVFLRNIFDIINTKFKNTNEKLRILEKKTIRDRLLEYFDILYKKSYTRNIYIPFSFKDLADYIAVNRSAMFREIKNLKNEKLIDTKGNRITLLYKEQKRHFLIFSRFSNSLKDTSLAPTT